ncbi:sigma-70 family RNA polymerase sigma factor [Kitasatospora sp. NPDC091207]|uniref:sigma-70 family RNA polymerase sigma factor n=1 Tax=Kitasatospora sp. NPDC091207 TaxID=3364083 RepID=UPI003805B104
MIDEVQRLAAIKDHRLRVKASVELMEQLQAAVIETSRMRKESIAWLRSNGLSMAEVAKLMGISRARVAQLKDAGPPAERSFLGTHRLLVAVPRRAGDRDYVAMEDSAAGQQLINSGHRLQLDGDLEYIPASGAVDLNRAGLVVICGPKSSPVIAEALGADPRLSFKTLDDGRWALIDRGRDQTHTSPADDPDEPRPADVAYLGRLPRPDGQGTFLLIAGVHAAGSMGAAHYLSEHIADLYEEAGAHPFSMVIGCEYEAGTNRILASHSVTGVLLHGEA